MLRALTIYVENKESDDKAKTRVVLVSNSNKRETYSTKMAPTKLPVYIARSNRIYKKYGWAKRKNLENDYILYREVDIYTIPLIPEFINE